MSILWFYYRDKSGLLSSKKYFYTTLWYIIDIYLIGVFRGDYFCENGFHVCRLWNPSCVEFSAQKQYTAVSAQKQYTNVKFKQTYLT